MPTHQFKSDLPLRKRHLEAFTPESHVDRRGSRHHSRRIKQRPARRSRVRSLAPRPGLRPNQGIARSRRGQELPAGHASLRPLDAGFDRLCTVDVHAARRNEPRRAERASCRRGDSVRGGDGSPAKSPWAWRIGALVLRQCLRRRESFNWKPRHLWKEGTQNRGNLC